MNPTEVLLVLLVGTVVVWLAVDVFMLKRGGMDATLSVSMYKLAKAWPIIPLLIGMLMGHFFFPIVTSVNEAVMRSYSGVR